MKWGTKPDQKQHVNSVAGLVPESQNGSLKKKPVLPQVKMFASTKAYVSAVLMLVCGLFVIIAGVAGFGISNDLPYHALRYVAMCRIPGVCAGFLFSIAGICAISANSKQSKPRLFLATVLSLITAVVALLIIIGLSVFIFYGIRHDAEMNGGNDRSHRKYVLGSSYVEEPTPRHYGRMKRRPSNYYPTSTPTGWDRPTIRPRYWPTRRPWPRTTQEAMANDTYLWEWTTRRPYYSWQSLRHPWYRNTRRPLPHHPTPPSNYTNPWDRTPRRPMWPTRYPWTDWKTRRPWYWGTTRNPWPQPTPTGPARLTDPGKWTYDDPTPQPTTAGLPEPTGYHWYWRTRRPWYWGRARNPQLQPTPSGRPETTRYPWYRTTRRPWYDWTTRRPWYWGTTRNTWPQPTPSGRSETTRYPWYWGTTKRTWVDWPATKRPLYDWTTRRPWYDWTTRRPWYDWTTRRPWYDRPTRRPWYDWPTRRPWYDWTTRRPWYDWTTRRPWYDWTTRRPWYDRPTRRPWYDWTTRRPWYEWTTRQPNLEQHESGMSWRPALIFIGVIGVAIMVLTELVNAVILTIFGFRSLRPHKYTRLRVAVNIPSDKRSDEKSSILADVDDLPVV